MISTGRILEQIKESIAQRFNKQKNNQPTTILKETATQKPVILQNTENDLLKRDEKQNLLEALNKEMTIEHPDGRKETHTILTDSILSKNSRAVIEVLKLSEEYSILEEILGKKVRIKQANGKEINQTLLDYANTNCVEIAKIIKEFQDNLNIPTTPLVTTSTQVIPIKQEETNKSNEDLDVHQPINESSEQNSETNEQEPNVPNGLSTIEVKPCSRSSKVDVDQANKCGSTALQLDNFSSHSDTVKYLTSKMVNVKDRNNVNKQAIKSAIITGVICSGIAALTIAIGCVVANVRLSTLAIAGIIVAAALAAGLVIGCITYIVSKPSSTMIDLDTQQHCWFKCQ